MIAISDKVDFKALGLNCVDAWHEICVEWNVFCFSSISDLRCTFPTDLESSRRDAPNKIGLHQEFLTPGACFCVACCLSVVTHTEIYLVFRLFLCYSFLFLLSHSIWWSMRVFHLCFVPLLLHQFQLHSSCLRPWINFQFFSPTVTHSKRSLRSSQSARKTCHSCSAGLPKSSTRFRAWAGPRNASMSWEIKLICWRFVSWR